MTDLTWESLHTAKHKRPLACPLLTCNLPRSSNSPQIWCSVGILKPRLLYPSGGFCKGIFCEKGVGVTGIWWIKAKDVTTVPATGPNKKSSRSNVNKAEADKLSMSGVTIQTPNQSQAGWCMPVPRYSKNRRTKFKVTLRYKKNARLNASYLRLCSKQKQRINYRSKKSGLQPKHLGQVLSVLSLSLHTHIEKKIMQHNLIKECEPKQM